MKSRRFAFWVMALIGAANAALVIVNLARGRFDFVPVNALAAALNLFFAHSAWKEIRDGRHRQAEEGARDPGALATGGVISSGSPYTITLHSTFAVPERTGPRVELERVKSDLPILAHRVARLTFGQRYPFVPYTDRGGFGVDATATCQFYSPLGGFIIGQEPHDSPGVDCSCGFHALPPDVEPWGVGPDLVTLMVELSGTVVEHERGYRAEHQRVVEVQIPPCPMCGDAARWVRVGTVRTHLAFVPTETGKRMIGVACDRHRDGDETVTVDDVRRLLGVPVTCQSLPVPKGVES